MATAKKEEEVTKESIDNIFDAIPDGASIGEEEKKEYPKLDYFKVSTLPKPDKGEKYGEAKEIIIKDVNTNPREGDYGRRFFVTIEVDGTDMTWDANNTQFAAILGSGVTRGMLPVQAKVFTWQNPEKPATHPGVNVTVDGVNFRKVNRNDLEPAIQEFGAGGFKPTMETGWVQGHAENLSMGNAVIDAVYSMLSEAFPTKKLTKPQLSVGVIEEGVPFFKEWILSRQ